MHSPGKDGAKIHIREKTILFVGCADICHFEGRNDNSINNQNIIVYGWTYQKRPYCTDNNSDTGIGIRNFIRIG